MKLKQSLPLSFFLVVLVSLLSMFFLFRYSELELFRNYVFSGDADKARVYATLLSDYYQSQGGWEAVQEYISDIPLALSKEPNPVFKTLISDRVVLADDSGRIVADSSTVLLGSVHPEHHLARGVPVVFGSAQRGTVLVGSMVDATFTGTQERYLESMNRSFLLTAILSGCLALGFGLLFAARITGGLERLNKAVARVEAGDLSSGLTLSGRDEFSELGSAFNRMTTELDRLEQTKRRLIADSAHELRTPVALIRGTLEAMLDGIFPLNTKALTSLHEESIRLSGLIDSLSELESIDAGRLFLKMEKLDLAQVATQAVSLFLNEALDKGIELSMHSSTIVGIFIYADPLRLRQILYNLLSNALRYCPSGGRCIVSLDSTTAEEALLRVDDSGSGIPEGERERIFERFYRLDSSRSSAEGGRGLGLSIALEIAKAHGGALWVEDSRLGGASFCLRLPRFSNL